MKCHQSSFMAWDLQGFTLFVLLWFLCSFDARHILKQTPRKLQVCWNSQFLLNLGWRLLFATALLYVPSKCSTVNFTLEFLMFYCILFYLFTFFSIITLSFLFKYICLLSLYVAFTFCLDAHMSYVKQFQLSCSWNVLYKQTCKDLSLNSLNLWWRWRPKDVSGGLMKIKEFVFLYCFRRGK